MKQQKDNRLVGRYVDLKAQKHFRKKLKEITNVSQPNFYMVLNNLRKKTVPYLPEKWSRQS